MNYVLPLNWKIIRTEEAYQSALSRREEILDYKKGDGHFDEAELLVKLIYKYEQENEPVYINPDPIEVIKYKMQENSLRFKDLIEIKGSKSIYNRKLCPIIRGATNHCGFCYKHCH